MSDQTPNHDLGKRLIVDLREQIQTAINTLPAEYAIPIAFPIIDAALWNFAQAQFNTLYRESQHPIRMVREIVTNGSAHYLVEGYSYDDPDEATNIAVIEVRMVSERSTYLAMMPLASTSAAVRPEQRDFLSALSRWILASFLHYFRHDQVHIASLPTGLNEEQKIMDLENLRAASAEIHTATRDRGGRPRQSDDDWAWEQIHTHHRPHNEVKKEWRQRNKESGRILKEENQAWGRATKPDRMKKLGG